MNKFENRQLVLIGAALLLALTFIVRLFSLQVLDSTYRSSADNQALRYLTKYPSRGIIYDRNLDLLVHNQAAFDIMIVPRQLKIPDTMEVCDIFGISLEELQSKINAAKRYSYYKASTFQKQLTADQYASVAEQLHKVQGFYGQKRSLRMYPDSIASHVLGYIGEVGPRTLERDTFYRSGDFIGISGLEEQYEKVLRGKRGREVLMVDVHNTVQGKYLRGQLDLPAVSGENLYCTIDASLQAYGEKLMANKKGSIVAIEPATGEVLCLLSAPTYDPNLLIGAKRASNYAALASNDSLDPLFNRALMAKYPPGSIFKLVQSLIGLELGAINENTSIPCNKSWVGCHNHPTARSLREGIKMSCNPYFHQVFKRIISPGISTSYFEDNALGLEIWRKQVEAFGLGRRLQLDLPSLKSGSIPSRALYDKIYGERRWAFSTIYSVSIGQGEVEVVPIQMANLAAIIANRGYYIDPHLVRQIGQDSTVRYERHLTEVSQKYFEPIVDAMQSVVEESGGTARRARIEGIEVCGKTGTAENPHGEDHSVFIAFAPKDNPKIAIAVYVENAGFGGTWAAPIASLMMEKYITGGVSDSTKQQRILEANFIESQKDES